MLQFEVLEVIELNSKFLTKSIKSRIFDRAHEFAEHLVRTTKVTNPFSLELISYTEKL